MSETNDDELETLELTTALNELRAQGLAPPERSAAPTAAPSSGEDEALELSRGDVLDVGASLERAFEVTVVVPEGQRAPAAPTLEATQRVPLEPLLPSAASGLPREPPALFTDERGHALSASAVPSVSTRATEDAVEGAGATEPVAPSDEASLLEDEFAEAFVAFQHVVSDLEALAELLRA